MYEFTPSHSPARGRPQPTTLHRPCARAQAREGGRRERADSGRYTNRLELIDTALDSWDQGRQNDYYKLLLSLSSPFLLSLSPPPSPSLSASTQDHDPEEGLPSVCVSSEGRQGGFPPPRLRAPAPLPPPRLLATSRLQPLACAPLLRVARPSSPPLLLARPISARSPHLRSQLAPRPPPYERSRERLYRGSAG